MTSLCLSFLICKVRPPNPTARGVTGIKGSGWFARVSQPSSVYRVFVTDSDCSRERCCEISPLYLSIPLALAPQKQSIPMATAAADPLIRGAGEPVAAATAARSRSAPSRPLLTGRCFAFSLGERLWAEKQVSGKLQLLDCCWDGEGCRKGLGGVAGAVSRAFWNTGKRGQGGEQNESPRCSHCFPGR